MNIKSHTDIDAIAQRPSGNLTPTRRSELAATVKSCPPEKTGELFTIFQESDNADEKTFVASLFEEVPATAPVAAEHTTDTSAPNE